MALQTGACMILAESGAQQDGEYLTLLIEREHVTTLHAVPSMLSLLSVSERRLPNSLTRILCIGETLPIQTAEHMREQSSAQVYNLYGPTEAAVSVTAHRTSDADVAVVPIGTPAWNTRLHVLDERLHPVPVGVAGELYLAGVQLARGYIGDAGQNSSRFVADPNGTGERLYRTGDLVRWNAAGSLEYLERADFQVKVRGFRIELGEIETALRAERPIRDAVVTVTTSATGEQNLVGYVTAAAGSDIESSAILARLRATLPGYMVPATLMTLDSLPLGSTGKVDRHALPEPVFEARGFRAPTTPAELSVATAFAEVLGSGSTGEVGIDDDFFERGGNSLSATRVLGGSTPRRERTCPCVWSSSRPLSQSWLQWWKLPSVRGGPRWVRSRGRRGFRSPLRRLVCGSSIASIPIRRHTTSRWFCDSQVHWMSRRCAPASPT